jgi:hypothetical protein
MRNHFVALACNQIDGHWLCSIHGSVANFGHQIDGTI